MRLELRAWIGSEARAEVMDRSLGRKARAEVMITVGARGRAMAMAMAMAIAMGTTGATAEMLDVRKCS